MKTILLNSPGGYPYMPYLATPLLKGYVESVSNHSIDQADLNLDYNFYTWSSSAMLHAMDKIINLNFDDSENLYYYTLCDYLNNNIERVYKHLKDKNTYKSRYKLENNLDILHSVTKLINFIDKKNNYEKRIQPKNLNEISELIDNFDKSFCGEWIKLNIEDYNIYEYDVVGLSITYGEQLIPSLYIAKIIKEKYPKIKILIGGALTVHFKKEILSDKSIWDIVDFCIFYQGEELLVELLNRIQSENLNDLINIAYFDGNNIKYDENLNKKSKAQAIPDFEGIDLNKFPTPSPIIPLLTSKGCYWKKCTYCSHFEGYGNSYYKFDNDIIIDTIKVLKEKYDIEYFYFVDEALPYKSMHKLSKYLIDNDIKIKWYGEARIDKVNNFTEFLKDFKESGCVYLVSGIESGNKKVLRDMKKGIDLENVERHILDCYNLGIGTLGMFFVGFPTETNNESEDTFRFINKNKEYLTYATVGVFSLERGTEIYKEQDKFGIEYIQDYEKYYVDSPNYKLKSDLDICTYKQRLYKLKNLESKYNDIKYKFTGEIHREGLIFLREMGGDIEQYIEQKESYRVKIKKGKFKNKEGIINPYKNQLKILR